MDPYEATKIVFSRIQHLDPENASKIMGLLLIQDHGEKEMIRLAFGPESLLHSLIFKARQDLGVSQNTPSTPSTPPSPSPFLNTTTNNNNNPLSLSRQNSSSSQSRLFIPNGLKIPSSLSVSSLASPSSASSPSWAPSIFPDFQNPDELISPNSSNTDHHLIEELHLQEQLSFLNDQENNNNNNHLVFPYSSAATWGPHRRSCSVSDISLGDDPALGWKPCLYYARGFCKNGSSCRFLHGVGDSDSVASLVGSPSKMEMMEQCHELMRSKSMQHHKLVAASQLMAASSFPFSGSKCLNFLVQQQQQQQQNESQRVAAAAAAALMMGEDMHKFSRSRLSRGDYGDLNPGSRQIYLTFPADSTFKEEDVSNYFSIFGPVQDVRIPYQQKRMFGFVTFVYPETVKIILAKGNPHFVCDARVLVKPYKEKGKVPDKFIRKQQQQQLQQLERGEFSACNSPTGLDNPRDPFDNQLGSRMMYNATQEMLWRKKLEEQSDFQQALELQSRRLMGLQLDIKRSHHHRALSTGAAPFPSPTYSPTYSQSFAFSDRTSPDRAQENGYSAAAIASDHSQVVYESDEREKDGSVKGSSNGKDSPLSTDEGSLPESLEHNLPDSPFASPTKGNADRLTAFTNAELVGTVPAVPSASGSLLAAELDLSPFKSCYFQMPRFSTGPGAIGM